MALANYTLAGGGGSPLVLGVPGGAGDARGVLDELAAPSLLPGAPLQPHEPYAPPRRSKLRKRAGPAYLPPPQYPPYPPHPAHMHTQVYQHSSRLDVSIENQRVQELGDSSGQYVHDASGDYDYDQRRRPPYRPPYTPATPPTITQSSRRFEGNPNQNVNFNFAQPAATAPPATPPPPPRAPPLPRAPGFTKVEQGAPGGKTQLHAVLDYDDEDYYDEIPGPGETHYIPIITSRFSLEAQCTYLCYLSLRDSLAASNCQSKSQVEEIIT